MKQQLNIKQQALKLTANSMWVVLPSRRPDVVAVV
jgi:hypothetical protein